jgi:hypothetical protein
MSDKKVILATWIGGSQEHTIDGVTLVQGEQQQVTAATAKRLESEFPSQAVVVHTAEGSKDDVRVPAYVVPAQPEEAPETPDWRISATIDTTDVVFNQHDSTPLEPPPNEKE